MNYRGKFLRQKLAFRLQCRHEEQSDDERGRSLLVNLEKYKAQINDFFIPALQDLTLIETHCPSTIETDLTRLKCLYQWFVKFSLKKLIYRLSDLKLDNNGLFRIGLHEIKGIQEQVLYYKVIILSVNLSNISLQILYFENYF